MNASLTPAQTVGPFFHDSLLRDDRPAPTADAEMPGERIRLRGCVYDGDGVGVPDAMLECWQGNRFTRVGTDAAGAYTLRTMRPRAVRGAGSLASVPYVSLAIFARGLLNHLYTRVYFPDEAVNASDAILLRVPADRRATLIATRDSERPDESELAYRFDIVLQGAGETVFFDFK